MSLICLSLSLPLFLSLSLSLSLSIMGEPSALGVIPQFANELYDRIEGTADDEVSGELIYKDYSSFLLSLSLSLSLCLSLFVSLSVSLSQTTYKVEVSYFEIYKERIHDLLASTKHKSRTHVSLSSHFTHYHCILGSVKGPRTSSYWTLCGRPINVSKRNVCVLVFNSFLF